MKVLNRHLSRASKFGKDALLFITEPFRELDQFFEDNQELFAIIGVFSAVSVYINGVQQDALTSDLRKIAVFAGFSVVVLASIVLIYNLVEQMVTNEGDTVSWRNVGLIAFTSLYLPLLVVITGLLSSFNNLWSIYFLIAIYLVGPGLALGYFALMERISQTIEAHLPTISEVFLLLTLLLPIISIIYYSSVGEPVSSVSVLQGGAELETWVNALITITLGWTGLFTIGVFFFAVLFAGLIAIADVIISIIHWLVSRYPLSRITPVDWVLRIEDLRESIQDYGTSNGKDSGS